MTESTHPQAPRESAPDRRTSASSQPDASDQHQRPGSPARKSKRGGRRPGAGAPRGNLNALKHGRYSQQFAAAGMLLAEDPDIRRVLIDLGRRKNVRQRKAQNIAAALLVNIVSHAEGVARTTELNLIPNRDVRDTISAAAAKITPEDLSEALENAKKVVDQSAPKHKRRKSINQPGTNSP